MLKAWKTALVTSALLCSQSARVASAAAPDPTLDQVIARHIEARGGAERWRAIRSLRFSGTMTYLSETGPFTLWIERGDRYLLERVQEGQTLALGFDGKVAWRASRADAGGAQRVAGTELAMVRRDADFPTPLFDYREKGHELALLGPRDLDGTPALAVSVKRADGLSETWYLDPVTCLDLGRDSPGSYHGDVVPMRTFFDDFREVAGVKVPFQVESQWKSQERILKVDAVEANVEVDAARFSLPRPVGMEPLRPLAGEWRVVGSQSAHPGAPFRESERTSVIESLLGGALLQERYTTASGQSVVRSFTYDRFRERYRVTEISDASNYLDVQEGVFDEQGRLVLSNLESGTPIVASGHTVHVRMTIEEIAVAGFRLSKEISTDGGKTWSLAAKAAYSRSGAAQTPYQGHGLDSVPAETIARFAPKPLPAGLASRIQLMMDVRAPGMGVPSPDGSRLYFDWTVTGTSQIWRLDGPDRFPVQLTGGEDRSTVAGVTPDGRSVIIQRDRKGEENPGLYLMPAAGGPLTVIQHLPKVQTTFDFVSEDGAWIYFHANDQRPDAYAVYRWSPRTQAKETIIADPGLWSIADHRPDGRLLLRKSTGALASEYSEWNPASRKLTPVIGQGEKEEYLAGYGARDGQVLVLTPKLGEFRRLYVLEKGRLSPITPDIKWDVAGLRLDEARQRILYTVNEAGFTRLKALDAATFAPLALPELPSGADHVTAGRTTADGRYTTIGVETAKAPRTNFVYDWKTGKLARWAVPSAPEVDTAAFAAATLETYPARDGTPIPVLVRRPAMCRPEPCPVLVEFHGGPEGQARPGFSSRAQIYVDAGFVFVQPNVRGSDGYGKTWLNADNGPKRLAILTDIEDAAAWARKAFAAGGRAPKVGVMGGSYGGYSTLIAMTKFAGAYDAGASNVGISNLLSFLQNTAPYRRVLRTSEYGDPEKDREALLELSAVTHIARLSAPLLIQQGANDPRVPVGEAIQMYEAAAKSGAATELILYADEGHGAGSRDNQVLTIGHTLRWMEQHLK